ncbi:MAG: hypothetical protein SOY64_02075 [Pyramidobacter sp.]|uniref:hypothetical protein n=1 Tax=Pyramidobacter sp. TaxID=1943581 RepID=UPI002A7F26B0|nr:hypothetical protein [Pyramidobacter sp.]MDY4031842.1 hypothetical protein [Pyramidobacter sp.]
MKGTWKLEKKKRRLSSTGSFQEDSTSGAREKGLRPRGQGESQKKRRDEIVWHLRSELQNAGKRERGAKDSTPALRRRMAGASRKKVAASATA